MIRALEITGSALAAQRVRMDVIAGNMANVDVTCQEDGTPIPYRRRYVELVSGGADGEPGVRVAAVREDSKPFELRYDPNHPNRILEGEYRDYVRYPNVNLTLEYIDALEASRAYEANTAMMTVTRGMLQHTIRMFA